MLFEFTLKTGREELVPITDRVKEAVEKSGAREGICLVYCPRTTAGITVNENADPDVARDLVAGLQKSAPNLPDFKHAEGNSQAHLKATLVGMEKTLIITGGKLLLGM